MPPDLLALQLALVRRNPAAIEHMDAPAVAVQLEAVTRCGAVVGWLTAPRRVVQLAAVRSSPLAIGLLDAPDEEVLCAAVSAHAEALLHADLSSRPAGMRLRVYGAAVVQDASAVLLVDEYVPSLWDLACDLRPELARFRTLYADVTPAYRLADQDGLG